MRIHSRMAFCFRAFPAASRAAALALGGSLAAWIGVRILHADARPRVFLLGDSFIGNYRYAPGTRLEDDLARLEPDCRIDNWAQPGAEPLDFLLQEYRGERIAGKPRAAIVAFSPDKFLDEGSRSRNCMRGANLAWIPWNGIGLRIFRALTPRERGLALVQQAALSFYGLADAIRAVWRERVEWDQDRRRMRHAAGDRHARIVEKAKEKMTYLDTVKVPSPPEFAALARARDADLLLQSLREEGVEARVVLLPWGNPELFARICPPRGLAAQEAVNERMRAWLRGEGVPFLDLTVPEALAHFPGAAWDDANHPKDAAVFEYMSHRIAETWPRPASLPAGPVAAGETPESMAGKGD